MLENDVDLSPAYASEEIDRFLYRSPGQAPSYFYGYATQLQLRKDTEAALGTGSTSNSSTILCWPRDSFRPTSCARP